MKAVVFAYSNVGDRCLRVLHAKDVDVSLVVTHRDAPGEPQWFERVRNTATELGLPSIYGEDQSERTLETLVRQARPDLIFSFYYRAMLPVHVLEHARLGAFNMHGSLLPKYRGRAPTNWAVLRGENETGATLHAMVAKPDAGGIVDRCAVPILPDDTGRQVFDKVTVAAEQVLWRSLPALMAGTVRLQPNDLATGSYFGGRRPEDGRIDWSWAASHVYNLIRAVAPPYPGAFTDVGAHRLVIASARRARPDACRGIAPGMGLRVVGDRILGLCGDGGAIDVHRLLSGSSPMNADALRSLLEQTPGAPDT